MTHDQIKLKSGPASLSTTVALLVIVPVLYCVGAVVEHEGADHVSAGPTRTSWVSGVVVDPEFGRPAAGARVILWRRDSEAQVPAFIRLTTAVSDSTGSFEIVYQREEGTVYRLNAHACGYKASSVVNVGPGHQSGLLVQVRYSDTDMAWRSNAPRFVSRVANLVRLMSYRSVLTRGAVR